MGKTMRVLLTGATGFIGSHVARELLRNRHEVHALVRPGSDRRRIRDLEAELHFHEGRLGDLPLEPDAAIHLAWVTTPGEYLTSPLNRELLDRSRDLLGKLNGRVVFAGTCFEFEPGPERLREDSPTRPSTLYAECKDALRRDVERHPNGVWVRFFYQYGPWEHERRLIPSVIRAVLHGEPAKVSVI